MVWREFFAGPRSFVKSTPVVDANAEIRQRFFSLVDTLSSLRALSALDIHRVPTRTLIGEALHVLSDHNGFEGASIYWRRDAMLEWVATIDKAESGLPQAPGSSGLSLHAPIPLGEGLAGRAASTGQLLRSSVPSEGIVCGMPGCRKYSHASLVSVPIASQKQVFGVINACHPERGFFQRWNEHSIVIFCSVLGHMLHSHLLLTRMEQEVEERTLQLTETNRHLQEEITERIRADDALQDSRETLKAVTDAVPAMINAKDEQSRYVFMNSYQALLYGVEPENAVGRSAGELLGDDYGSYARQLDRKVLETGCAIPYFEERYKDARGKPHTLLTTKVPLRDSDDKVARVATIALDISERKKTEKTLKESQKNLSTLMRNLPGMVYRRQNDLDWSMDFTSEGCSDLTGYEAADFVAKRKPRFINIIHPGDRARVLEAINQSLIEKTPYQLSYRITTADGCQKWVGDRGTAVYTEEGELLALEGFISDITESQTLSERLAYQASHDPLTGLVNRREFENRLEHLLQGAHANVEKHALCYLDLDQFKIINDTCGHIAGDEMLRQLATVLQSRIDQRDTLARLGGDEFGILIENCSLNHATMVANKLRKAIDEFRFIWAGKTFGVGVSIGLVPISKESGGLTDVLSIADTACYAAKDQGRNRIHICLQSDDELSRRHSEMRVAALVGRALDEDRFRLNFQPIVPVSTGLTGDYSAQGLPPTNEHYELLLRMVNDDGEIVLPGTFLAAAERYDLVGKLDRWVISRAFNWLMSDPQHLRFLKLCSINISGHSVGDEAFLSFVLEQLDQTRVPAHKICFEITETSAIANLASAGNLIHSLKARNCRFALDDFGSGFSSFAYLKSLPVDFLKIDGMFIRGIAKDPIDLAMLKSINDIGRVTGKQTIAECVEDGDILSKLKEVGVDYAQGYAIGMPRPIEEMRQFKDAV
jgi:diguanylate cyclase (GGDEF)-like protein/PAS domain S-box-containing protein